MADRGDRLAGLGELLQERDHALVGTQVVGVHDPARENDAVVILRRGVGHEAVDRVGRRLVDVVHRLDLALLDGEPWRGRPADHLDAERLEQRA